MFLSDCFQDDEPKFPKKLFMKDNSSLFFEDLLLEIFSFVPFEDIVCNISNVCSDWNKSCWKSVTNFLIKEEWNKNLTNKYIKYIITKKCTRIEKLTCYNNMFVTSESLSTNPLESLTISRSNSNDIDCLKPISEIKNLRHLLIDSCKFVSDDHLKLILNLNQLESLKLHFLTMPTDESLKLIPTLKHLKNLEIKVAKQMTDISLKNFDKLSELESFVCEYTSVTNDGLKCLKSFQNLTTLKLSGSSLITDDIFEYFPNTLTSIDLEHCPKLTLELFPKSLKN
eukprot:gene9050-1147_t